MSLSLFAADTLVLDYLNGRLLPSALHRMVLLAAETRLLDGLTPVLDEALCTEMDDHATALAAWSVESVLNAARAHEKRFREALRTTRTLQSV